jgi:hypothetical protein
MRTSSSAPSQKFCVRSSSTPMTACDDGVSGVAAAKPTAVDAIAGSPSW